MTESAQQRKPDKAVTIKVNNRDVRMPDGHATGTEIKAAAGLPPAFKVYDPKGREVADNHRVKLKAGDRFTSISGQDVS